MTVQNFDYLDDLDGDELRSELIRLARTQGAKVAFRSAMAIAADETAASQARSNAQRTLLTIGGMLDHRDRPPGVEKDPAEMDGIELQEATRRLLKEQQEGARRLLAKLQEGPKDSPQARSPKGAAKAVPGNEDDIFG